MLDVKGRCTLHTHMCSSDAFSVYVPDHCAPVSCHLACACGVGKGKTARAPEKDRASLDPSKSIVLVQYMVHSFQQPL